MLKYQLIMDDFSCIMFSLEQRANDLHMVQLMLMPPDHLLLHLIQIGLNFLFLAYPGCPGKETVKQVLFVLFKYRYC